MAELCCALLVTQRADRVFREHRDAFLLSDDRFVANYRLTKGATRWLCEQLRPDLQPDRTTIRVITVEQQVLCALRFYAAGGFQGTLAEPLAVPRWSAWTRLLPGPTLDLKTCGQSACRAVGPSSKPLASFSSPQELRRSCRCPPMSEKNNGAGTVRTSNAILELQLNANYLY